MTSHGRRKRAVASGATVALTCVSLSIGILLLVGSGGCKIEYNFIPTDSFYSCPTSCQPYVDSKFDFTHDDTKQGGSAVAIAVWGPESDPDRNRHVFAGAPNVGSGSPGVVYVLETDVTTGRLESVLLQTLNELAPARRGEGWFGHALLAADIRNCDVTGGCGDEMV